MINRMHILKKIGIQLLFWLGFWTINFIDGLEYVPVKENLFSTTLDTISILSLVYLNVLWIIPRFLYRKKHVEYLLILTGCTMISTLTVRLPENGREIEMILDFVYTLLMVGGLSSIWLIIDQLHIREKLMEVEKEQTTNRLRFLKAQTSPHFLFNVLNNINYLIESDAKKASQTLIKLSDMMRYQLYETDADQVSLRKETEHLRNYISLERLRFGNRLDLTVDIDEVEKDVLIAPFLLLPLLENAFKHSAGAGVNRIDIQLKITQQKLELITKNSIPVKPKGNRQGLGIDNLQKRLKLMYPGKHTFSYGMADDMYEAHLSILF